MVWRKSAILLKKSHIEALLMAWDDMHISIERIIQIRKMENRTQSFSLESRKFFCVIKPNRGVFPAAWFYLLYGGNQKFAIGIIKFHIGVQCNIIENVIFKMLKYQLDCVLHLGAGCILIFTNPIEHMFNSKS